MRVSVKESTPIYSDFKNFLRHDDNKTELFQLIAKSISDFLSHVSTKVTCTKLKTVTSNSDDNLDSLHPCNHEEADTRIFVHLNRASSMGLKRVLIKCNDADVVAIAIAQYHDLGIEELWVEFGVRRKKRWLPIHAYAKHLGRLKCLALLFWYAFTGCDTVSSFNSRGKKTAWVVWAAFPEITDALARLSLRITINDEESVLLLLERFVVLLYDRRGSSMSVNDARRWVFTMKGRSIENCPPTSDALLQHIRRAVLQSICWRQALLVEQELPDREHFGWKGLSPVWMTVAEAAKSCQELVKCGCKKVCSGRCKCKKGGFKCTELCQCSGGCTNIT